MKSIHSVFESEEYEKILKVKKALKLSWHDFMLLLGNIDIKATKKRVDERKNVKPKFYPVL